MSDSTAQLVFQDCQPHQASMLEDVLDGLSAPQKRISCKYFYDERGSRLFERISGLDEYYLTRCELAIMQRHSPQMAALVGPGCMLIEYGSGSGVKTRLLLDELNAPAAYLPVDISGEHLRATASEMFALYPGLDVYPICGDFDGTLKLPRIRRTVRCRVVYFPGSTIGNFDNASAIELMRGIRELCGAGGGLLIGVDLKKNRRTLEAAYSDREGVTRQFNLNLLTRLNRELGADFRTERFHHHAFYNEPKARMESYLVSRCKQTATVAGREFHFDFAETIHMENSYKYDLDQFASMASAAGFEVQKVWTDDEQMFSVQYLTVA